METRIDKILDEQKNQELYSDFVTSFVAHPISGKIKRVTNEQAVIQGVRNRIKTMFSERLYQPQNGSLIYNSLFEPNDSFLQESIDKTIRNSLQNDERVKILRVDTIVDDVDLNINITVLIANNTQPITINVIVRRTR
jgi:phage baseplate assembly protein W